MNRYYNTVDEAVTSLYTMVREQNNYIIKDL